jgi:hypothetical protein
VLVQVKNKRERSILWWPPGDGEISRLGLMDPVGGQVRAAWCNKSKMKP